MAQWPGTPASAGTSTSSTGEPQPASQTVDRDEAAKRPRACDGCRASKVRCVPPPLDAPGSSCPRCVKAGKQCVTSAQSGPRKKRRKAVSRVHELEKKIDRLTANLSARENNGQPWTSASRESYGSVGPRGIMYGVMDEGHDDEDNEDDYGQGQDRGERGQSDAVMGEGRGTTSMQTPVSLAPARGGVGIVDLDIVRRGLLSHVESDELLGRYNTQMVRHLPLVVFPDSLSAARLRETRPTVFLAVMAAATYDTPDLQRRLVGELDRAFAEKIAVAAEKSLELIQALQISIAWTWLPNLYEEMQFYQRVHTSTAMAVELGLGRRPSQKRATPYATHAFDQRRGQGSRAAGPIDPTSLEARRAWLACYYLSSTSTMMKRRPLLLTWTRFMTESCEILRTATDRAPTDEYLWAHVWAQRLAEDVAQQVADDDFDDPAHAARLSFSLRKLDQDLNQFQRSLPEGFVRETLAITFGVVLLYMYGVALHCDFIDGVQEERRPSRLMPLATARPGTSSLPGAFPASTAHISTISSCLVHVQVVTEAFLAMSLDTMRSVPTFNYGRVVVACVMLFKLYIFVDQDPSLASVVSKDQLGVGLCIDRLTRQFHAAAAGRRCRAAARLLAVLLVVKDSFHAYCARVDGPADDLRSGTRDQPCHSRGEDSLAASGPVWSLAQQPPQLLHRQPTNPALAEGGIGDPRQQPGFLSETSSHSNTNSVGLPSWEGDFLADLSVEEFSYTLGLYPNDEADADYYDMSRWE